MISVLIATYNGAATLPAVLDAYCGLQAPDGGWELILADNGSSDASAAIAEAYARRLPLRLVHEPKRGKNAALNRALPEARGELLVFSDDDAAPRPDWLRQFAACAARRSERALFGGRILPDWECAPPDWIARVAPLGATYGISPAELAEGPVYPGLIWGANMAVRRAVFAAGHRFDESIGPAGGQYAMGSETEFNLRLARAGYGCWYCPAAQVAHRIRAHQLTPAYVLARAQRLGRGQYRQDQAALAAAERTAAPPPARTTDAAPAGAAAVSTSAQRSAGAAGPNECADPQAAMAAPPTPLLLGAPRWMARRCAEEAWRAAAALLAGDVERGLRARWELHYHAGYYAEAWRQRRQRRAAAQPAPPETPREA